MSTSREESRVVALRGATSAAANTAPAIREATAELLSTMLGRNEVEAGDLISVIFTATPDLDAAFPATAARALGIDTTPLLSAAEIDVPGALPRCIRVLMHLYTNRQADDLQHVYLREARSLREDLSDGL